MVYFEAFIFILGLVFLVKGSDYFVKSAASIAKRLGVSEFIIGVTLVAVGTSIPELASSIAASIQKVSGLIVGGIVGSNIANIGLIAGTAAIIAAIKTEKRMIWRDGLIMLFAAALFYIFIMNGVVSRVEAGILLILYVAYVAFLIEEKPEFEEFHFGHFLRYFFGFRYLLTIKSMIFYALNHKKPKITSEQKRKEKKLFKVALIKDFLVVIISGIAIIIGAKYLVDEAIFFAGFFKVPINLIGLSAVAIGTSLPELSVSITAALKGYGNIAIGNIIGSNIANIFLVIGISGMINPISVIKSTIYFTAPFMILISILLLDFIKSHWEIRRIEGTIFLILYTIFIMLLFFSRIMKI